MLRTYQQFSRLPLGQKLTVVRGLTRFPALSVMVFLRDDIGYRILIPKHLFWIAFSLVLVVIIAEPADHSGHAEYLFYFAITGCFLGLLQRSRRFIAHKRGVLQHSYYIGTSVLLLRWFPKFLHRRRILERYADPAFCLIVGRVVVQESPPLGLWLYFAGLCLWRFEGLIREKELNECMDVVDGLVQSEVHTEQVETFEPAPQKKAKSKRQKTFPLPTGIGADIAKKIKRRKR